MSAAATLREFITRDTPGPGLQISLDELIKQEAALISQASDAPMKSIVGNLAESIFQNFKLLPSEVEAKFKELKLANILVNGFIENLRRETNRNPALKTTDTSTPQYEIVRDRLMAFLENYDRPNNPETLSSFIRSHQVLYPDVSILHIFNHESDIRALLRAKIEQGAHSIINATYQTLYEKNPDQFALDVILRNVISYRRDMLKINHENLKALVEYLDSRKYPLDNLYMVLYRELRAIGKSAEVCEQTRAEIARKLPASIVDDSQEDEDPGLFHHSFDYDTFFDTYFKVPIQDVRQKRMARLRKVRIIDLQAEGDRSIIIPEDALRELKDIADLPPDAFMDRLRKFFTYSAPEGDPDHLSDKQVKAIIGDQLEFAANQITYTCETGLKMRNDSNIHKECSFLKPILTCRDPRKLITWLSYPDKFKEDHPKYNKTSYGVVRHQARRMLELLILYRKHGFEEKYKDGVWKRGLLEKHLRTRLGIEETELETHTFRVSVEIDPETREPLKGGSGGGNGHYTYDVLFPDDKEWAGHDDVESFTFERDGHMYQVFPVEEKNFQKAAIHIPETYDTTRDTTVSFYTKDKKLVQYKSLESYISSWLRDKQPTDIIRLSMVTDSPEDEVALRNLLYEYTSGGEVVIKDRREGRDLRSKGSIPKRSAGSQLFADQRGFSSSMYAILPVRTTRDRGDGVMEPYIDHVKTEFETQILGLKEMLISGSDYAITSHHRSYMPDREFKVLFEYLFPPLVYGKKFANYYLQGYKGDQEV